MTQCYSQYLKLKIIHINKIFILNYSRCNKSLNLIHEAITDLIHLKMGRLHVCNNECIHVCHLVFRLFNFTDSTSFIRTRSGLIHELTINYSIIYFVVFCNFIKFIYKVRCLSTKYSIFFNRIT